MSNIILKKWNELQVKIEEQKNELNRDSLLTILFDWINQIQEIKESKVQNLYQEYLEYFEEFSVLNKKINIRPWYSLSELIDFDLLKSTILSFDRPIVKVRDVLWELLVLKCDKECTFCEDDNFRVMVFKGEKDLFFSCDMCGLIVDENGERIEISRKLYPAPFELIESKKIKSSCP